MGQALCLAAAGVLLAGAPAPEQNDAPGEAPIHSGATAHVIIIAIDYKGTGNELTCTVDGRNMQQLCSQCGVTDVVSLFDNDGNYSNVDQAIKDVGSRCQAGDFFILYYSGHGTRVPDKDGDEASGKDDALCLVTPDGKLDWDAFMTDDQLSEAVNDTVAEGVNVLILSDCCHSGTIADFRTSDWGSTKAVSMSGCTDDQTSGDTGKGGIFTHSMLLAIAEMSAQNDTDYSCGELYNLILDKDNNTFNSEQDIKCGWTDECGGSEKMAWPLIPTGPYQAPWGN